MLLDKMTEESCLQSPNAQPPIFVTVSGITIEVKFVPANAESPISVTVSGIVMVVKPGQSRSRLAGLLVIPVSNSISLKAAQPMNGACSSPHVPASTVSRLFGIRILVKLVQFEKAPSPNFTMLLDKMTEESCLQFPKAQSPISDTVSEIVTLVRDVQPWKAPLSMSVTLSGIVTLVRYVQL